MLTLFLLLYLNNYSSIYYYLRQTGNASLIIIFICAKSKKKSGPVVVRPGPLLSVNSLARPGPQVARPVPCSNPHHDANIQFDELELLQVTVKSLCNPLRHELTDGSVLNFVHR